MKQIAKLVISCLIVLFISGCGQEPQCPQCSPVVMYAKPTIPEVPKAVIAQCRYESVLDNIKCLATNYFEMKKERDSLRAAIEELLR